MSHRDVRKPSCSDSEYLVSGMYKDVYISPSRWRENAIQRLLYHRSTDCGNRNRVYGRKFDRCHLLSALPQNRQEEEGLKAQGRESLLLFPPISSCSGLVS